MPYSDGVGEDDSGSRSQHEAENAQLRGLLRCAPAYISRVGLDWRVQYSNLPAPQATAEEIVGTSVFDYLPPSFHEPTRAVLRRVVETGEIHSLALMAAVPDQGMRHFLTRVSPVMEGGEVVSLVLASTDIT